MLTLRLSDFQGFVPSQPSTLAFGLLKVSNQSNNYCETTYFWIQFIKNLDSVADFHKLLWTKNQASVCPHNNVPDNCFIIIQSCGKHSFFHLWLKLQTSLKVRPKKTLI